MRKISFVATRPIEFKIGAWIIMNVLQTDFSHVAILFHSESKENKFYPYEATGHNDVNFMGQIPWQERNLVVWQTTKEVSQEKFDAVLDFAMSMCGVKYAYWQNIGIKLCDWFGIKNNPWTKGQNCSELVKLVAELVFDKKISTEENKITPRQAVDALREGL